MRAIGVLVGSVVLVVTVAACGGDSDGGDTGDATTRYCQYSASLGAAPTAEQLDELRRLAPDEIADDVDTYAAGLQRVVEEPDVDITADEAAAIATIDAWEREHCVDDTEVPTEEPTPSDTEPIDIDDLELDQIEPDTTPDGGLGEITDIEVLDEPIEDFEDGSP